MTVHVISTVTSFIDAVYFTGINHVFFLNIFKKRKRELSLIKTDINKTFCSRTQDNTLNDLSNLT